VQYYTEPATHCGVDGNALPRAICSLAHSFAIRSHRDTQMEIYTHNNSNNARNKTTTIERRYRPKSYTYIQRVCVCARMCCLCTVVNVIYVFLKLDMFSSVMFSDWLNIASLFVGDSLDDRTKKKSCFSMDGNCMELYARRV
jgi:hypothetical protein